MRLINFGTLAAVAVTAMALGQTGQRNGPGVPLKRGSKVGNRFRGWKKFPGKNAKGSKKGPRKPGIPNSRKKSLIFTSGYRWRGLPGDSYKDEDKADLLGKVDLPANFQIEWEINSFKLGTPLHTFPLFIGDYDFDYGLDHEPDGIIAHLFLEYSWNDVFASLPNDAFFDLPAPTVPRHKIILRSFNGHQTLRIKRDVYDYGETNYNGEVDCQNDNWYMNVISHWTDKPMTCKALISDLVEVEADYYVNPKHDINHSYMPFSHASSAPVYFAYINELSDWEEFTVKDGKSSRVKIYKLD